MADNDPRPPIVVEYNIAWSQQGASVTERFFVPRATWDALTPRQRNEHVEALVDEAVTSAVTYGWHLIDPDDEAALA